MSIKWTPEKIADLSDKDLKRLLDNCIVRNGQEIVELCKYEIESREIKKQSRRKVQSKSLNRNEETSLSYRARSIKRQVVSQLAELAHELLSKYDLSIEKAKELSKDIKGFRPHSMLGAKGRVKTGGDQRNGLVVFDRYISYRLKNQVYTLGAIVKPDSEDTEFVYQIFGPENLLNNFKSICELRPYLEKKIFSGKTNGGQEFKEFSEAADKYKWLIDQIAPRRNF